MSDNIDTIKIKKGWSEVTIGEFKAIIDLKNREINEDFTEDDLSIAILEILSNKDSEYFYNIPYKALLSLYDQLDWISSTKIQPEFKTKLKVAEKTYYTHLDLAKLTAAQYIDYQNCLKEDPDNISRICAIFLIPKDKSYEEDYNHLELVDIFDRHLGVQEAQGIGFFFLLVLKSYTKAILSSSIRKLKKQIRKLKRVNQPETLKKTLLLERLIRELEDLKSSGLGK